MLGNYIIRPLFIEQNLTGEMCLDMLENAIEPLVTEIIEKNTSEFDIDIILHGAPPFYDNDVLFGE